MQSETGLACRKLLTVREGGGLLNQVGTGKRNLQGGGLGEKYHFGLGFWGTWKQCGGVRVRQDRRWGVFEITTGGPGTGNAVSLGKLGRGQKKRGRDR